MKQNLKQLDYDIAEYRNGSTHLKKQNEKDKKVAKVVGQRSIHQKNVGRWSKPESLCFKLETLNL